MKEWTPMERDERIVEALVADRVLSTTPNVWLDLAHGLVTADEVDARVAGESPELVERSKALFSPPTREREERLRRLVLAAAASPVVASPARTTRTWAAAAAALAAVVVLAIAGLARDREPVAPFTIAYHVELSDPYTRLRSAVRSDATHPAPRFRIDQRVTVTLRPADHGTTERITFVGFAFDGHGGRPLSLPPASRSERGTVYFSARLDELGVTPGEWQLVFVLGRPGHLPRRASDVAPGIATPAHAPYVITRETIVVEPAQPHVQADAD